MDSLDESLLRQIGEGQSNSVIPILKSSDGDSIKIAHILTWIAYHLGVLVTGNLCLPQSPKMSYKNQGPPAWNTQEGLLRIQKLMLKCFYE